jgi:hypothetical protein
LKTIDLGIARIQHCPVGKHWTLVVPVRAPDLTDEERFAIYEGNAQRVLGIHPAVGLR